MFKREQLFEVSSWRMPKIIAFFSSIFSVAMVNVHLATKSVVNFCPAESTNASPCVTMASAIHAIWKRQWNAGNTHTQPINKNPFTIFWHPFLYYSLFSCGNTSISVTCGREKKTKPPKCSYPCKFASKCHHANAHKCHMSDCPVCVQPCLLANDVTGCEHPCPAKCHDAVKVAIVDKNFKPAGPWDVQVEKFEIQKLPHPPCAVKVPVDCLGGHENALWPCWNSTPGSCGRICGRSLKCGNHVCEKLCHEVQDITSTLVSFFSFF